MKTLVLNAHDILTATDRTALRNQMAEALRRFSTSEATNFPRQVIEVNGGGDVLGFMPAHGISDGLLGYKAVSVFSDNPKKGLNPHQGVVMLLDASTGAVKSIQDGSTVTAIRTAAVSAAATEILSRRDSRILALIGAGRQAFEHALALSEIRSFEKIIVFSRSKSSAEKLMAELRSQIPVSLEIAATPEASVADADIVVTCTASPHSILDIKDFKAGAHINAIGACRPGYSEIQLEDRDHLKIYLDSKDACFQEASEIIDALSANRLNPSTIIGEIGDCFAKKIVGRRQASDITLFKSVGLGIEDLFAADLLCRRAKELNMGISIDLRGEA